MDSSQIEKDVFSEESLKVIAEELLRASNYAMVEAQQPVEGKHIRKSYMVDIQAKFGDEYYYVDVKASTTLQFRSLSFLEVSIQKLVEISTKKKARPVLMVFAIVSENDKTKYKEMYDGLIIFDLPNILYTTQETFLQPKLIGLLPFSVDQVEYTKGDLELNVKKELSDSRDKLIKQLDNCIAGKKDSVLFEKACFELLRYVLSDDLSLWSQQAQSNNKLYRFDLLCRIKDNTNKTVWSMLERYFNSKYVIFEFKNYTEKITQKEVYTTEKYLYSKALRSVAFIIAKNGFDENSKIAAAGCLREEGKLIVLLTVEDIKKMYELKKKQEDPTTVILENIDNLLIHLEK